MGLSPDVTRLCADAAARPMTRSVDTVPPPPRSFSNFALEGRVPPPKLGLPPPPPTKTPASPGSERAQMCLFYMYALTVHACGDCMYRTHVHTNGPPLPSPVRSRVPMIRCCYGRRNRTFSPELTDTLQVRHRGKPLLENPLWFHQKPSAPPFPAPPPLGSGGNRPAGCFGA